MTDFEMVMEQYAPMISAVIRKLHIYREYESFRQVGKIALWQAWERYDETKGNFTPFAYRSIHGAMLDELKRESRLANRTEALENGHVEQLAADFLAEDSLPEWIDAVPLSEQERLLLEELFIHGKSLAELAVFHGLSLAGMKKRRERLLKKLRRAVEKE